jgi:prepilin-type N-terminal cleavage/methylation domain-containing protein
MIAGHAQDTHNQATVRVQPAVAFGFARARRSAGFTLIELVLATAILVVAAAMVWPRYGRAVASYRAESAARRIAQDLNAARAWARERSQSKLIIFGATGYSIAGMKAIDGASIAYSIDLTQEPYRSTLASVDFGGSRQCMFDGYGAPQTTGTVRVTCGGSARTISMDAAGNITIALN